MYTLYVSRDKKRPERFCLGSVLCMRIMEYIPKTTVNLVECHSNGNNPSWLIGTPTLAPEKGVEIYRGTEAVFQLLHITISESKRVTTEGKAKKGVTFQKSVVDEEAPQEDEPWITESNVEEDDSMLTGKLTMEDLNRAVSSRTQSAPPAPTGTPPPPPPPEDD